MKSSKLLNSFVKYCEKNPDLRFWQALVNWCGSNLYRGQHSPNGGGMFKDVFYRTKK